MIKIKEEETKNIVGGASISASFINGIIKGISLILELGRSIGSAIRRSQTKILC